LILNLSSMVLGAGVLDSACQSRLSLAGPGCDQLTTTNCGDPQNTSQSHSLTARFLRLVPTTRVMEQSCHLRCVANLDYGWIRHWMFYSCLRDISCENCPDWISVFVYVVADWLAPVAWRNAVGR